MDARRSGLLNWARRTSTCRSPTVTRPRWRWSWSNAKPFIRRGLHRRLESRYIPSAMSFRAKLGRAVAVFAWIGCAAPLVAQDHPIQRVANIVSVAVEEYGKGVDDRGRLIAPSEYEEAIGFLGDARDVASRLPGSRASIARALLDSIAAA